MGSDAQRRGFGRANPLFLVTPPNPVTPPEPMTPFIPPHFGHAIRSGFDGRAIHGLGSQLTQSPVNVALFAQIRSAIHEMLPPQNAVVAIRDPRGTHVANLGVIRGFGHRQVILHRGAVDEPGVQSVVGLPVPRAFRAMIPVDRSTN